MKQTVELIEPGLKSILTEFEKRTGIEDVEFEVKSRTDGQALILKLAEPSERFYGVLEDAKIKNGARDNPTITIKKRTASNRLHSPEAKYFLRVLSESLNISRLSFKDDFFARYTKSVSNAESQITAAANHVVFGRRGAGKSSLLLYAMRRRERDDRALTAWVAMQVYEKRDDNRVVVDILREILEQLRTELSLVPGYAAVSEMLERQATNRDLTDAKVREFLPEVRRLLEALQARSKSLFIFLDDFHVLHLGLQPRLLGFLYAVTRGTDIFLKLSAIETLTNLYDTGEHVGLQVPHDAQTIKLDYKLTMPDKAASHIEGILDAHALYCGLPSVRYLCNSSDVLSRLVWVSAGVPRDALNLFAQAMTKGIVSSRSKVSVTDVNLAVSEMVSQKLRELEIDLQGAPTESDIIATLEDLRDFCIKQKHKNAFLVAIRNDDSLYRKILKLVDLRVIHVISEGITVGEAGNKFLALILDYGFYTGIRAAQSVDLFNKQTERVTYRELRKLPIFKGL